MTAFEYFTVLLSFVVSLGVASLLHAVARLIQEASRVRFSLAYALWAAVIFELQITFWLRSWSYHETFTLRTETSVPPLVLAIIAFIACGLATPHIPETGSIDLREFHARQGRKYQVAYAIFMLIAIVQAALMSSLLDESLTSPTFLTNSTVQVGLAVLAITAAIFRNWRWLQIAVPALFLISAIGFYPQLMEP